MPESARRPAAVHRAAVRIHAGQLLGGAVRRAAHDLRGLDDPRDHRAPTWRITLFIFMVGALPALHDHLHGPGARSGTRRSGPCSASKLATLVVTLLTALLRGGAPSRLHLKGYNNEQSQTPEQPPARARRGARLRPLVRRRVPRGAVVHARLAARHLGHERQLAQPVPERRGVRHAHLPHVAVLLHRGLLRAPAVPEARRALVLGESRQAHRSCRWSPAGSCCSRSSPSSGLSGITKVFGGTMPPMPEMPKVPGAFPLTHLWFLYQLLLIYVAVHRGARTRRAPRSRAEAARPRRQGGRRLDSHA